jgi:transposase InsO family protein
MSFAFIDRQDQWAKAAACGALSVSRSGYYAWSVRRGGDRPSPRQKRHQQLVEQVRLSFLRSRQRYGAPRITADLISRGTKVCVNTVAKILRECGLSAKPRRRFVPRTTDSDHGYGIAPNRLARCFKVDRIDRVWAGDISYIRTEEGWLYLATLMDLFSRRIVGWATHHRIGSELTCRALQMAIDQRRPAPGLICHSDRGRQYACRAYQQLLLKHHLLSSMSRRGDCYDNAPSESFFATLKGELEIDADQMTRARAESAIFEYIEVFYNRKRLHSALGQMSPEEFEAAQRHSPKPAPAQRG